ncbi:MAG: UDP-N-acetylmuramate--L-alanine ligase [Gemmatimonadetes bacterium]|nr:UDP-N-acetylmuramate--L-alanine ligase [Gemmatimonadota bacterium]MCY3676374.1 UDP-N-acetylmuramate--L-alanine ligase [Gemmatimonadota bacterium]
MTPRLRALAARGPIHFMGVCGAGMAPLAEMVLRSGAEATGCDLVRGRPVEVLCSLGMGFALGHDPAHVESVAAVVVTSAVPSDHPELQAARARGIPVLKRSVALGQWVNEGRVVGIAGTHGKTTTTAMATHVLEHAGVDPTGVVGGEVRGWGGNLRPGGSDVFVVEADEYDRSFLDLDPGVAVVTNVEADHLDVYGDLAGVRTSFSDFVDRLDPGGTLWVCGDDPGAARIGVEGGARTRSYGLGAGVSLRGTLVRDNGSESVFRVTEDGVSGGDMTVPLPGLHNVRNALAAAGVGRSFGAAWDDIRSGLASFPGVGRRYDILGVAGGVQVIDDYAHHPTEISATLAAARRANPGRRIVAVFQPHLFTRTRDFHTEFGGALAAADLVWVTDVYPAREKRLPGVTGELVARAVRGTDTRYHAELATLPDRVAGELSHGDVCVVMGAGSIEGAGSGIVDRLADRAEAPR